MVLRLIGLAFLCACLSAQSITGVLVGTVSDSSGAAVAGTKVKITNEATGAALTVTSNESGDYVAPNLAAGTYSISTAHPGFKKTELAGIRLMLSQTIRTDIRLDPGAVDQTITVEASVPVIQSETSSVATNVDTHAVASLPLNGRTLDRLILIAPGNTSDWSSNPKLGGATHWGGSFFTIDGVAYNDQGNGGAAYSLRNAITTTPSIDTIQEFKIESNGAKAEQEGAAAISIITKSGGNSLHGALFEFNRNREFAANEYFSNAAGLTLAPYNRNEFGASAGGRIIKNKTFFFGSYEGLRERTSRVRSWAYATEAMRGGDFSKMTTVIKDPLTSVAFPGNIIPTARLDSRALKIQSFVPLPNGPGTRADGTGVNYTGNVPTRVNINRYSARLDDHLNERNTFNVILSYSKGDPYFVSNSGPAEFGNYSNAGYTTKSGSLTYTRVLGTSMTNEARASYFTHGSIRMGQNTDFDPRSIFPTLYGPLPVGGLPTVSITGYSTVQDLGGADRAPQITTQLTDNFTWIRGAHTVKAGVDIGLSRFSTNPAARGAQLGTFSFNGRYSANAYSDFLLGYPITTVRGTPTLVNLLSQNRYSAYVQDDWRATSRLTFNIGIRYMIQTAPQERDGSMTNFDLASGQFVVRTVSGQLPRLAIPRLLNAYPYVTSESLGWGSDVVLSDRNNFAPRFGFAFRPAASNKTVLRGSYGIFYNQIPFYQGPLLISQSNIPFSLRETYENGATRPVFSLADPFPGNGTITANPTLYGMNRQMRNTYAQQWNLTVEHEVTSGLGLRATYIGNKAVRVMQNGWEKNLPYTQTAGTIQSQRPYQPWASISYLDFNGNSNTHQMQIEATQRMRSGLFFQASYTWNKTLDDVNLSGTPQNPYDAKSERSYGEGIRSHVAYASATYDLPFGPGRTWLNNRGFTGLLLGGWRAGAIVQLRSGVPFSVNFSPTLAGWYANRPDVVAGAPFYPSNQSIDNWFNASAFSVPASFTFGNSARNLLFGPGQAVIDLSAVKVTPIGERFKTELRGEFFNAPNHPTFSTPSANISTPSTVGRISATLGDPRIIQFGLKLLF
ncbi:MAG: TonB-dependent receptor [Acidobacteria bacterium]|nr:TonB-dependent receptor [Acidobacteriota bacterium]